MAPPLLSPEGGASGSLVFLGSRKMICEMCGERKFSAHTENGEQDSSRLHSPIATPPKRKISPPTSARPTPISKSHKKSTKTSKKVEANAHNPGQSKMSPTPKTSKETCQRSRNGWPIFLRSQRGHSQHLRPAGPPVRSPHRPAAAGGLRTQAVVQP